MREYSPCLIKEYFKLSKFSQKIQYSNRRIYCYPLYNEQLGHFLIFVRSPYTISVVFLVDSLGFLYEKASLFYSVNLFENLIIK